MAGKILRFTEKFYVQISIGTFLFVGAGIWTAAIQFTDLKKVIETSWSWKMDRDSWRDFRYLNSAKYPEMRYPDIEHIRADHQAGIFKDNSPVISQR